MSARSKTRPEIPGARRGGKVSLGTREGASGGDEGPKSNFGREANLAIYAEERGTLVGRIDRVYGALSAVEGLIDRIAQVLRISQPPMRRKVDLRWWTVSGKPYRDPVPVRWIWEPKMARYVPRPLQRLTVRQHANFQLNSKETQAAFAYFRRWEDERKKLRAKITTMRKIANQLDGLERAIEEEKRYLDRLWYDVVHNLLADGREVDGDVLDELERLMEGDGEV